MLWFAYGPFSIVDEKDRSRLEDDRAILRGFGYSMVKNLPVLREMKGGYLFRICEKLRTSRRKITIQVSCALRNGCGV